MRVEAVFDHVDDVWIPYFRPTGETVDDAARRRDRRRRARSVHPPDGRHPPVRGRRRDLGRRHVGHRPAADALAAVAGDRRHPRRGRRRRARAVRHRRARHLPGRLVGGRVLRGRHHRGGRRTGTAAGVAQRRGRDLRRRRVASPRPCSRCRRGWSATSSASARSGRRPSPRSSGRATRTAPARTASAPPATVGGCPGFTGPYGVGSVANNMAMLASNHFHRYGTTRETLGWIALNQRRNAGLNPAAIYRDPMTMDDYLSARMISTPLGLFDCDVPADVVDRRRRVASRHRARPARRRPSWWRRSEPR